MRPSKHAPRISINHQNDIIDPCRPKNPNSPPPNPSKTSNTRRDNAANRSLDPRRRLDKHLPPPAAPTHQPHPRRNKHDRPRQNNQIPLRPNLGLKHRLQRPPFSANNPNHLSPARRRANTTSRTVLRRDTSARRGLSGVRAIGLDGDLAG